MVITFGTTATAHMLSRITPDRTITHLLSPLRLFDLRNYLAQLRLRKPPPALGKALNKAKTKELVEFKRRGVIVQAIRKACERKLQYSRDSHRPRKTYSPTYFLRIPADSA